ncbi:MAG: ATP-binding protein, partial [Dehalococcoidia bacterium]
ALDILSRLVDKSLVLVEDVGRSTRYRLLEPVRQHAVQHLLTSGDGETTSARHAAFYLSLAERAEPELRGPEQVAWLKRLDREQDNLRAALRWTQTHGEAETGLRLAGSLVGFWEGRGYLSEGRRWLAAMLTEGPAPTPSHARVKALLGAGHVAQWQADLDAADTFLEESLAMARALEDAQHVAESLAWLGTIHMRRLATTEAVALLEESLALSRDEGDTPGIAFGLLVLGVTVGNDGDVHRAAALLDESVTLFRQLGDVRYTAIALTMRGDIARERGDLGQATALLREGLAGHRAIGDRAFLMENLLQLAGVAVARGQMSRAARLLGATEAARGVLGVALAPTNSKTQELFVTTIRAQLAQAEFEAAWAAGRAMTLDEAAAEEMAIGRPASPSSARATVIPPESPPVVLTRREEEVARLVAQEHTDRQIAAALGITVGTVGIHIHNMLAKLGVRSRWQVADWALAQGLLDQTADPHATV